MKPYLRLTRTGKLSSEEWTHRQSQAPNLRIALITVVSLWGTNRAIYASFSHPYGKIALLVTTNEKQIEEGDIRWRFKATNQQLALVEYKYVYITTVLSPFTEQSLLDAFSRILLAKFHLFECKSVIFFPSHILRSPVLQH